MKIFKHSTILMSCLLLTASSYGQKFIKPTGTGTQDGSSWDNALPGTALTATLNAAGDVKVYMAAGNYTITASVLITNKNFYLKGGYPANATGLDTSGYAYSTNKTVIRETTTPVANRNFSISVGATQTSAYFQGVIFTDFNNTSGPGVFDVDGPGSGGLNFQLIDVEASGNTAENGGVLRMRSITGANKYLLINNCAFAGNKVTGYGGVFYFSTVYTSTPGSATGSQGGSAHGFNILNSTLRNNLANNWGGVFFITTGADFLISGNYLCSDPANLVSSGSVAAYGGIFGLTTTNRITIADNVFTGGRITGSTNGGAAIFTQAIYPPGNLVNANRFFNNTGVSSSLPDLYVMDLMNLTVSNNLFDKSAQPNWVTGTTAAVNATVFSNNTSDETNFVPNCPVYVPLPVSLLNFEAISEKPNVKLFWATVGEANNRGFEIQRSEDGKQFVTIGFLDSKSKDGNSKALLNYEFIDYTAPKGKLFYRLVQNDNDNHTTISKTVLVSNGNSSDAISIFPNPIIDKVNVLGLQGNGQLFVYDQTGKMIYKQPYTNATTDINLEHLENGIYSISIIAEDGKIVYRKMVVKIK